MAAEFPHCYGANVHPTYVGAKYSCSICMEETVVDDDESNNHLAHFNGCAHTACMRCLTQWMEGGRYDCPQCRTPCDGIQTVAYTLHVSNQEFMVLDTEIATMQRNIEEMDVSHPYETNQGIPECEVDTIIGEIIELIMEN